MRVKRIIMLNLFLIAAVLVFAAGNVMAWSSAGSNQGTYSIRGGGAYSVIPVQAAASKNGNNWQKVSSVLTEMGYNVDSSSVKDMAAKTQGVGLGLNQQDIAKLAAGSAEQVKATQYGDWYSPVQVDLPPGLNGWMQNADPRGTYIDPYSNQYTDYSIYYDYSYPGSLPNGWNGQSGVGYNMNGQPYYYSNQPYFYGTGWENNAYIGGPGWGMESNLNIRPGNGGPIYPGGGPGGY